MHKPYILVTTLLISLLLAGCGFQLRGQTDIPEHARVVALTLDKTLPLPFVAALKQTLTEQGVRLADTAAYRLKVDAIKERRHSITLDRQSNVDEYELVMRVNFALLDGQDESLSGPLSAQTEQVYDYDANAASASHTLLRQIQQDMWQRLAQRIVKQYAAQARLH